MRRLFTAAVLIAMASSVAGAQAAKPPCDRRMVVSADSLRDIARRLHPESADTAQRRAYVTVGFVFDSECRLVRHAVGRRTGPASANVVLGRLIPEAVGNQYVTSGFVELPSPAGADSLQRRLARAENVDFGAPWVVWGVQQSAPRR